MPDHGEPPGKNEDQLQIEREQLAQRVKDVLRYVAQQIVKVKDSGRYKNLDEIYSLEKLRQVILIELPSAKNQIFVFNMFDEGNRVMESNERSKTVAELMMNLVHECGKEIEDRFGMRLITAEVKQRVSTHGSPYQLIITDQKLVSILENDSARSDALMKLIHS
jgi:hypothetical protein